MTENYLRSLEERYWKGYGIHLKRLEERVAGLEQMLNMKPPEAEKNVRDPRETEETIP